MPDYDTWDLTNDFTVAQASCLWCEVDPDISFLIQKSRNPRIAAIEQMLVSEIRAGRLRADSTQNVLSSIGDYSKSLVSREALKELAETKGLQPKFLFPSARQPRSEVQAGAPAQGTLGLVTQSSLNENRPEPAPGRRFSEAALRKWYEQRVKDHAKNEKPPSREDDWAATRTKFGDGVPRDAVRALRRELAPVEWKKGGHPKTGGRKHGGK